MIRRPPALFLPRPSPAPPRGSHRRKKVDLSSTQLRRGGKHNRALRLGCSGPEVVDGDRGWRLEEHVFWMRAHDVASGDCVAYLLHVAAGVDYTDDVQGAAGEDARDAAPDRLLHGAFFMRQ
ncbi:hypothetical protein HPP92_023433 [Vanilla planifolia]|uniref:Uncharacterized protein n=1 Tax=Vanilla planifolia TaxID=51239 RepID=A0A835UG90_VANPL|nr:hypothetical protein HPP92_023433 [Vanilla planifolia]